MNYKELTISQKEKILEMLKNGYSNTYIAKKIKVTPYKVSILRLIYNIKTYRAIHQVALTGPAECIRCSKRNCLGCPYYLFEEADKKWRDEKKMKKISDKRKAKGEIMCWNSTIKAKAYTLKKSPIRKVSKKSATLWNKARNECFEKWGKKCFLCGETKGEIHCHHWQFTRSQEPSRKYDLDNLVPLCQRCHSHNGVDKRFYELKNDIENKMKGL